MTAPILAALIVVVVLAAPRGAQAVPDEEAARAFILRLSERTFEVLRQPGRTRQSVEAAFRDILRVHFDIYTIGRFVLGRHWNSATPAQQQEYLRLFEDMIVLTYARRFDQYSYSGETVQVARTRPNGDTDVMVESQVMLRQRAPLNVGWRVRERTGQFRIIDIVVEGISLTVTQRNEFGSVIEQNGGRIDPLLDALRRQIANAGRGE